MTPRLDEGENDISPSIFFTSFMNGIVINMCILSFGMCKIVLGKYF